MVLAWGYAMARHRLALVCLTIVCHSSFYSHFIYVLMKAIGMVICQFWQIYNRVMAQDYCQYIQELME